MDTKLKNRHKLGVVLIFTVIITISTFAVGMYPYMGRKAQIFEQQSESSYQEMAAGSMSTQLMNSVYSLWMEQAQQKAGHLLTPSQVFVPELRDKLEEARAQEDYEVQIEWEDEAVQQEDEERNVIVREDFRWETSESYYQEIQNYIDERGEAWRRYYKDVEAVLDYQLLDNNGRVLAQRRDNKEANMVHAELVYDASGNMTVTYEDGGSTDQLSRKLAAALNYYTDHNPLRERYGSEYHYSGIEFQGPANVVYKFWLPEELLTRYGTMDTYGISAGTLYYSGVVQSLAVFLIIVVSVAALLLPCFKTLRIGQEKLFRVPFEIVFVIATIGIVIVGTGELPAALVAATLNGTLTAEFQEMGITLDEARDLVSVLNGVIWTLALGIVYWVVTCLRSIFTLGLWRYMKERTLLGYFCCWLKRLWDRFYESIQNVDFREKSTKVIVKIVLVNFVVLTLICCFWLAGVVALVFYSILLFAFLQKYWGRLQERYVLLLDAFRQVAGGNFDTRIEAELGIFEPFRAELDTIQDGLKQAVDKEVKSQKMKTELITNVSHDLKTPLTAIITYVNLLKEENLGEEERAAYIEVLEQKSMRLKVLIEDLFEVSKANSHNITLHPEPVDVVNLMKQVRHELSDKLDHCSVDFRWTLPEEKVILTLDGQKTCRIFENLLINIAKYAMPGTRAYIDMMEDDGRLMIIMRNISATELSISGQDLTERFVRGDESRNTEGSGLGLAIARSFTEVQGGTLTADTEADLFRVILSWPIN